MLATVFIDHPTRLPGMQTGTRREPNGACRLRDSQANGRDRAAAPEPLPRHNPPILPNRKCIEP